MKSRLIETLESRKGRYQKSRSEIVCLCPFHDEKTPSFCYNLDKDIYYCFGCGVKGSLFSLAKHFGLIDDQKLQSITKQHQNSLKTLNLNHWKERGIDSKTLLTHRVGTYRNSSGIIGDLFPCFDLNGQLTGIKKIPWNKEARKKTWIEGFYNLFGLQLLKTYNPTQPLFLTEGEKDMLALRQMNYQAIGISGTFGYKISYNSFFQDFEQLIVCFDRDQAGVQGQNRVAELLQRPVQLVTWDEIDESIQDINDLLIHDPKNFTQNIQKLLQNSKLKHHTLTQHQLKNQSIQKIRDDRKLNLHERKKMISRVIIDELGQSGKWYYTDSSDYYYFDNQHKELLNIDSLKFSILLNKKFEINKTTGEFDFILFELLTHISHAGTKTQIYELFHYNKKTNTLYIHNNNNQIYKVTSQKITKENNGIDGILFLRNYRSDPWEMSNGNLDTELLNQYLFHSINFSQSSQITPTESQLIFEHWFFFLFFVDFYKVRPILTLVGEKGSGKTTILKLVRHLFLGEANREPYVLGESKSEAEDYVCSEFFWFFDNQDSKPLGRESWIEDFLATLSTGFHVKRRKLYTNDETWQKEPRGIPAITSRTPHFRRDDVADRLLILELERRTSFPIEPELVSNIEEHRNQLWTLILKELQKILGKIQAHSYKGKLKFRLSTFAHFCLTRSHHRQKEFKTLFKKLTAKQDDFALEDEPLFIVLEMWLENPSNQNRWISTKELFEELKDLGENQQIKGFPRTVVGFGKKLSNLKVNLMKYYAIEEQQTRSRKKEFKFESKQDSQSQIPNPSNPPFGNGQLFTPKPPEQEVPEEWFD